MIIQQHIKQKKRYNNLVEKELKSFIKSKRLFSLVKGDRMKREFLILCSFLVLLYYLKYISLKKTASSTLIIIYILFYFILYVF